MHVCASHLKTSMAVQHYAIHAINNIASRSNVWVGRLTTNEAARALVQISEEHVVQPAMREAAAATLALLLHANPSLAHYVVATAGWQFFVSGSPCLMVAQF